MEDEMQEERWGMDLTFEITQGHMHGSLRSCGKPGIRTSWTDTSGWNIVQAGKGDMGDERDYMRVHVCKYVWERERESMWERERDWINFLYYHLCSSPEVTHCLFLKEDSWPLGWHPWPPWFVGIIPLSSLTGYALAREFSALQP